MSEISIIQQIKQIKTLKEYIGLCAFEVERLQSDMNQWLSYLREEGLTKEFADEFEWGTLYMKDVYRQVNELVERMQKVDYRYLDDAENKLKEVL
ncbi:MAG: hypothetical protein IKM85_00570 [Bacteroidales bacterium]|nr:hypothetical protein [Bacteroidales bacterium]